MVLYIYNNYRLKTDYVFLIQKGCIKMFKKWFDASYKEYKRCVKIAEEVDKKAEEYRKGAYHLRPAVILDAWNQATI